VALSSNEAEYVAISEAVKEIRFMRFLLSDFAIDVDPAIVVKIDNIGAMFKAQNILTGVRTHHVDTRYHFIRENVKRITTKIKFLDHLIKSLIFLQRI
jgi:hypothetical protein